MIKVMPNIEKFINSLNIFAEEEVIIGGIKYTKYWYYDDNGLYQYVYDYA